MAIEDQMNDLQGPTDAEKAGIKVEIVSGDDQLTAGEIPEEESTAPEITPETEVTEELVIPVEGVTPKEPEVEPIPREPEPVEKPEAPPAVTPAPEEKSVAFDTTQQPITAGLAPVQPTYMPNIVGSSVNATIETLRGEDGEIDPLRVPDPFDAKNGEVLYKMFFENEDPEANALVSNAITGAVGFVVERDTPNLRGIQEKEVILFNDIESVYDRTRFLVAEGGTHLVYPQIGPDGRVSTDADGRPLYNAETSLPIMQDLETFRRPSETDIDISLEGMGTLRLRDLPRADFTPEGQEQLDNFLQNIGMSPYERVLINRAEYSGYLPEVISRGRMNEIYAIPQNIATGIVNQGAGGVFNFMSEFANIPDQEDPTKLEGPFIPYAPTFSQEMSERLGISEADAEALISHSGDAVTRTMRIAKETLPILMSFWGGRALRDKKIQDRFINWTKDELGVKTESEILAKLVSRGETLDGLLGRYIRTQVKAPIKMLQGFSQRSTVRALQRASSPMMQFLSPSKKNLVQYNQAQLQQLENAIASNRSRIRAMGGADVPPRSTRALEIRSLENRIAGLEKRRDRLMSKGIKDLVPASIKKIVTEEGLALGGAAIGGQVYQDLFNNSSSYLSGNTMWAEAFGSVMSTVFIPMTATGAIQLTQASIAKAGEVFDWMVVNTDSGFQRKVSTGDAALDSQIDKMYRGLKAADPEFQKYVLDQFDHLRAIRDQLATARDADGNLLLSAQDVRLTFSQMAGLMIFDSYSNYITRSLADSEIADVTAELVRLETTLIDKMSQNNALARSVQKITRAGLQEPNLAPLAKTLRGFVDDTQKNIDRQLAMTQAAVQRQADIAKEMLSGNSVLRVDEETGEVTTLNFEEIFRKEDEAIINTGLRAGEPLDVIQQRLVENAAERLRIYREGLSNGTDIFTAQDGLSSEKFTTGFWSRRHDKFTEVSERFDSLREDYPNAFADGRFLIEWIEQNAPELMTELGQEVTLGARQAAGVTLNSRVRTGSAKALHEAYNRFEANLLKMGADPTDIEMLKEMAGKSNNGLDQFLSIDRFLRQKALDEDGDGFAQNLLNDENATAQDLIRLADNMELPLNFSDVHLIASSLGKLASKYEGTPQSIPLAVFRETFLDNMASPEFGFRINGDFIGEEIMTRYGEARQFASAEYYNRFHVPGTWPNKFAQGASGSSEGLPVYKYKESNSPAKALRNTLGMVDGFFTRPLDVDVDADSLGELEVAIARVWGEYDPATNSYFIDLDSPEAVDLGRMFQGLAAEEFLKSDYARELLKRTSTDGFDLVREILQITKATGEYNPTFIDNLTKIRGRRRLADGTLSDPEPIVGEIDISRAVDIDKVNLHDEKTRELTSTAAVEVKNRALRLMNESTTESRALQKKLRGFESLVSILETDNPGMQIHAMMRSNPQKLDQLRDRYMTEMVTSGAVDTFEEAGQMFNDGMKYALGQAISDRFIQFQGRSVFGEQMKSIRDPAEMARFLGAEDANLEEMMREVMGDEHYQSLRNIADFYAGTLPPKVDVKYLLPTDLTPEALYSRLNNINRGVAGIRWTVTEFLLRSMRSQKSNLIQVMFENPDAAEVFEAIILQNKEISPSMWSRLEESLFSNVSQSLAIRAGVFDTDIGEVEKDEQYRSQLESMGLASPTPSGEMERVFSGQIPVSP